MVSWWRRNLVPLVVVGVSIPALLGVLLGLPLLQQAAYDPDPVTVAFDEPYEVDGYTFRLVASGEFPSDENENVPAGLSLVAAIIEIRPGPDIPLDDEGEPEVLSCDATLVGDDGERSWDTMIAEYEFGYVIGDDSTTTCLLEGEAFDYETVFLAPEGTLSTSRLDVEVSTADVALLRFALTD